MNEPIKTKGKRREPRPPLTDEAGEVRELTVEDFRAARPIQDIDPGMLEAVAALRRKIGRPKAVSPKVHIGFRLAAEVVESIKATGRGYNARVEAALRKRFVRKISVRRVAAKRAVAKKPAR